MIAPYTVILALVPFLPQSRVPAQEKRASPATLIEQARYLAEEKAEPKAALQLLVDQVICRKDLSKSQFDRVAAMIALYAGGKVPDTGRPAAQAVLPRQDLSRLIDEEIDAYIAGKNKSPEKILWFGKPAFARVLSRLQRDYIKPGVAKALVPVLISRLDPEAAARYLSKLRQQGPAKLREIVGRYFGRAYLSPKHELVVELLAWAAPGSLQSDYPGHLLQYFSPEELSAMLARRVHVRDRMAILNSLSRRSRTSRLRDPRPLFELVRSCAARLLAGKYVPSMGPHLAHWLWTQQGGFEVLASTIGWGVLYRDSSARRIAFPEDGSFHPDFEASMAAFASGMPQWGREEAPYGFFRLCLRKLWNEPIEETSAELQGNLLQIMQILDKAQRQMGPNGFLQGQVKAALLEKLAQSEPEFQVALWQEALTSPYQPFFKVALQLRPAGSSWPYVQATILLLTDPTNGEALFPSRMKLEQRIALCLRSMASGDSTALSWLFGEPSDRTKEQRPAKIEGQRRALLAALLAREDLHAALLAPKNLDWLKVIAKTKMREVLGTILANPKVEDRQLYMLLGRALDRVDDPAALVQWVRSKRPQISPFLFAAVRRPDKALVALLLDMSLTEGDRWQQLEGQPLSFLRLLAAFPSRKGRQFLGLLLLGRDAGVRKKAREVLDDWQRIAAIQRRDADAQLVAALSKKTAATHPIAVRTLALKGLFELGSKPAWLLLSDWLESKDPALKKAAEALAAELHLGK